MNEVNEEMRAFWNGDGGRLWASFESRLESGLAPFGVAVMDRLSLADGQNVLDVGCGCGGTTFELARRVGVCGRVRGLDISAHLLDTAKKRAAAENLSKVEFDCADAQTRALGEAVYDRVFSRFGVMFFDQPSTAFRNIRGALQPGGQMGFACWAPRNENQWVAEPLQVVGSHLELPPPPPADAPGPFALAEPERVRSILSESGFGEIEILAAEIPLNLGADTEEAVAFLMEMSPTGRAITQVDPELSIREAIAADLRTLMNENRGASGITLNAKAWLVFAKPL